jgi:hypothetical protein
VRTLNRELTKIENVHSRSSGEQQVELQAKDVDVAFEAVKKPLPMHGSRSGEENGQLKLNSVAQGSFIAL